MAGEKTGRHLPGLSSLASLPQLPIRLRFLDSQRWLRPQQFPVADFGLEAATDLSMLFPEQKIDNVVDLVMSELNRILPEGVSMCLHARTPKGGGIG